VNPPTLALGSGATVAIVERAPNARVLDRGTFSTSRDGTDVSRVAITDGGVEYSLPLAPEMDLLIVSLAAGDLSTLGWALAAHVRLGSPELLFIVESARDPAAASLTQLGLAPVLAHDEAAGWGGAIARLLVEIRRGRRAREQLEGLLAQLEARRKRETTPRSSLHAAEQRFRETYVRALLATSESRREAAERAGLPYRTFCQIALSLGLGQPASRKQKSPGCTG
jgi:hypothetical protein